MQVLDSKSVARKRPEWFDETVRKVVWQISRLRPFLHDDIAGEMYLAIEELGAANPTWPAPLIIRAARNRVWDIVLRSKRYNDRYGKGYVDIRIGSVSQDVFETLLPRSTIDFEDMIAERVDLESALSTLGSMDRAIVLLRVCFGYTNCELGELFGVHNSTISKRYSGAVRRIREKLNDEAYISNIR